MNWISVKDKLPPEDETVLAFNGYDCQTVWYYHHRYKAAHTIRIRDEDLWLPERQEKKGWACVCEDSYYGIDEFTHWMPLPEPPKGTK